MSFRYRRGGREIGTGTGAGLGGASNKSISFFSCSSIGVPSNIARCDE
jgi:hypothetical protein